MAGTVTFEKYSYDPVDEPKSTYFYGTPAASCAKGAVIVSTLASNGIFKPMWDTQEAPATKPTSARSIEVYEDNDLTNDGDPELDAANGVVGLAKDIEIIDSSLDPASITIKNVSGSTKYYTVVFVCEV